ncbi:thioredoxin domain-containing protein 2-like [Arvicola amphibius]|uniref:thioredoxin domain-containing protein 2-like n=1 Tax=Arvicola amphibius TaxID=1047088 RepID=UPI001C081299|nr:thioredoxin domain-containing protein 2-like [Arvicola amphibius]
MAGSPALLWLADPLLQATRGQCQFSHSHALKASSPSLTPPGPALLCCSVEVQSPLSQTLQLVKGRNAIINGRDTVIHLSQQERVSSESQMLIMVQVINNMDELKELLRAAESRLVVVEFSARWCGPCKRVGPIFQAMSLKYQNVMFANVDVDASKELTQLCHIKAVPTFQMFKHTKKALSQSICFCCYWIYIGEVQDSSYGIVPRHMGPDNEAAMQREAESS